MIYLLSDGEESKEV